MDSNANLKVERTTFTSHLECGDLRRLLPGPGPGPGRGPRCGR
jgi:hypothetical protein